jgi:hypothetical protein
MSRSCHEHVGRVVRDGRRRSDGVREAGFSHRGKEDLPSSCWNGSTGYCSNQVDTTIGKPPYTVRRSPLFAARPWPAAMEHSRERFDISRSAVRSSRSYSFGMPMQMKSARWPHRPGRPDDYSDCLRRDAVLHPGIPDGARRGDAKQVSLIGVEPAGACPGDPVREIRDQFPFLSVCGSSRADAASIEICMEDYSCIGGGSMHSREDSFNAPIVPRARWP